ncbi:MAG: phenylacetate--CoA ligase [Pseudomonadota bacterium]
MFWEKDIELIGPEGLKALQLTRLRATLEQARRAPFYQKRLASLGLGPESIKSLDDVRRLPFTSKEDLRAGFPYEFLAVHRDEVVRLHASSGTTGTPTAVYHTQADLDTWSNLVARCLYMAGLRRADVFQNLTGYGLFTGGLGLHYGAERLGAMVIPSGAGNSRRQVSLMRQFGTTALHIIPSYAVRILETFQALGLDPRKDSRLRLAILGAEPHSEDLRRRIERGFGVLGINSYGLSEMNGPGVAFECPERAGMHLWEDAYLLEVVDPVSLEPVPQGEQGEIVLTTLTRQAMPVIRYRTRDLGRVLPGACACGRTHRRLDRIGGRSDDMFIIKGVNIYPLQVESVLLGCKDVGNNYLIVLERQGASDHMTVRVEVAEKSRTLSAEEMKAVSRGLAAALKDELLVSAKVELAAPGSLYGGPGKAQRVQDLRPA